LDGCEDFTYGSHGNAADLDTDAEMFNGWKRIESGKGTPAFDADLQI